MSPRFFVNYRLSESSRLRLSKEQSHHLITVLRAKESDKLELFNGIDGQWTAQISKADRKSTEVVVSSLSKPQDNTKTLRLFFAPTKNMNPTYIVEKATELGATQITPIVTSRTIVRKVNSEKLMQAAIDASQQCERLDIPIINPICSLKHSISSIPESENFLFCDEARDSTTFIKLDRTIIKKTSSIIIGPEGGFTEEERAFMKNLKSCISVCLGPRILRADTAAVAALSAFQSIFGDWNSN